MRGNEKGFEKAFDDKFNRAKQTEKANEYERQRRIEEMKRGGNESSDDEGA